ncbi:winged helix-turn-helix transcriptional regulator [Streptomyces sp. NPDC056257]|uniref:winged helix-turn-helix transcriptional regulator n=1 Tax=Streptomyces sp. NPDC056257 TaxID=3345765 RepID=UPI0035DAF0DD
MRVVHRDQRRGHVPVCPSPLVPFRIGDKWATLILRCLERDGFVTRTECDTPERRVEHALTPLGRGLPSPLDAACGWTREHWDELIDAQEAALAAPAAQPQVREQSTSR